MPTKEQEFDAVARAIVEAFAANKFFPVPTKVVAERMGWTPAKTNRVCNEMFEREGWSRITPAKAVTDVVDRCYGGVSQREVPGWRPAIEWMVQETIKYWRSTASA